MEKIVVIRRNGLGDFIAGTVPVCNFLQNKYGECEFHFFMSEINFELVKYFFPKAHVYCIPKGNKYIQTLKTAFKNRHIKASIGFSPMPDYPKLNSLFLYFIGAKDRYGRITNHPFSKLLNKPYYYNNMNVLQKIHVALYNFKFFDDEISTINEHFYPRFNKKMIKSYTPQSKSLQIMVEVSNSSHTCQLSNIKTSDILNSLYKKYNFSILITAKEKDYSKAFDLKNQLNMQSEIFTTSCIHDFISFVNASDIVLCGDGGLGHIAGALNKKIVSLYGGTSIKQWGILTQDVTYLYDKQNINNISSAKILNVLEKYIKKNNDKHIFYN